MLVANKGERGKRKLADKWDPVVYTVVDRNLQTHTYKLKDEKGNVRIVHRNLMLDISFLPVELPDEEGSVLLSAGESEDETRSTRSEFGVEDFDPSDLEERAMRWVNRESESPLVHESESPLVHESESPLVHESESPLVHESESPLVHESESPLVHESESPSSPDL